MSGIIEFVNDKRLWSLLEAAITKGIVTMSAIIWNMVMKLKNALVFPWAANKGAKRGVDFRRPPSIHSNIINIMP